MTASGQLSRPPAGTFVTAYGQSLVSVVNEDRDDDGDRAPVILQPKHRMVPLPVRVKSSRGRKPETSVNG